MGSQSAGIGSALPDQTDNSGKVLVTDGVVASWASPDTAALPVQTGHDGEFLQTDGTDPSWVPVIGLPDQTLADAGKVLSTDGSVASWVDATGLTLGAFSSTPTAEGMTLAAGVLNLDPADGTHAGGVSIAAQTFAGVKTFSDVPVMAGVLAPTTSTLTLQGQKTDGGTSVGVVIDAKTALTTSGAKIVSFQNAESEKAFIDKDGALVSDTVHGLTAGATNFYLGSASGFPGLWIGAGADTHTTSNPVMLLVPVSNELRINAPSTSYHLSIDFNSTEYWKFDAISGHLISVINGKGIQLKSPDGTTYTATIANGGTWSIT